MKHTEIPFSAAIFDLDGTLLDSNWVWRQVDEAFFAARGIPVPEDYGRTIQGMSFRETAEYTVRRFGLDESADAVIDEWMSMTARTYASRVDLKGGARDYLRRLKRAGVKLAVATANREALFGPTLERWGVLPLFDAICTSAEVGDVSKANGALFRLAAKRLGVAASECAVFEDVPEGIAGAKRAGMRAYAVLDAGSGHSHDALIELADGAIEDFTRMDQIHALPDEARRCVIFTARCDGPLDRAYAKQDGDYVLCADGGWELARRLNLRPDCVIGDFDSSEEPEGERTVRVPVEKDDTDTMLCLKRGLALGFDDFLIVGGFGGRLDHTLANLQTLHYAASHGVRAEMCDGATWAVAVRGGEIRVPANRLGDGAGRVKLSVFALSDACRGVTLRGAKYALKDGALTNAFPLGVSNEFAGEFAEISVREGCLLAMVCGE